MQQLSWNTLWRIVFCVQITDAVHCRPGTRLFLSHRSLLSKEWRFICVEHCFCGLLLLATFCFHTCGQIMCTTRFYGSFSATSRSIPFFVVQHPVRKLGGRGASRGEPKTRFWGNVYRPLLFHPLLPEVDRMQRCGALVALLRSARLFFSFMARKCHNSEDGDSGTCDGS